jgi:hypothetical protein
MLNRQLMFDDVAKHMAQQRKRSTHDGTCLYRGPNGLKCGIGALIPDANYSPAMDMAMPFEETLRYLDKKYGTIGTVGEWGFASDAIFTQRYLHDTYLSRDWDDGLRRDLFQGALNFAVQYGLDFTVARRVLTRDDDVPASRTVPTFTEENHETYVPTYAPAEFLDSQ